MPTGRTGRTRCMTWRTRCTTWRTSCMTCSTTWKTRKNWFVKAQYWLNELLNSFAPGTTFFLVMKYIMPILSMYCISSWKLGCSTIGCILFKFKENASFLILHVHLYKLPFIMCTHICVRGTAQHVQILTYTWLLTYKGGTCVHDMYAPRCCTIMNVLNMHGWRTCCTLYTVHKVRGGMYATSRTWCVHAMYVMYGRNRTP
jgi:hypothetical protein